MAAITRFFQNARQGPFSQIRSHIISTIYGIFTPTPIILTRSVVCGGNEELRYGTHRVQDELELKINMAEKL